MPCDCVGREVGCIHHTNEWVALARLLTQLRIDRAANRPTNTPLEHRQGQVRGHPYTTAFCPQRLQRTQ